MPAHRVTETGTQVGDIIDIARVAASGAPAAEEQAIASGALARVSPTARHLVIQVARHMPLVAVDQGAWLLRPCRSCR